ncbi:LytTR family DNA-binding domain-containing protein [uncultured Maribacter sp.]|uniref:LytR/AlgR family response regulator transcription factor n=1 Tax=uncultured Maribacter sp. TaxID=431308 RepID=UPI0026393EAA|nr:LytTR family DNA-binding domain-containing protein [uncultured Maribacter sp.]
MNCILIEDEIPAQKVLLNYISKIPEVNLIGVFQSALDANNTITNTDIDCIFLDINLPDISGLQFIKTIPNSPAIIMTTAYPEHAVESFELENICDYLVKPFSFERFLKAVNKYKRGLNFTDLKEGKKENCIFLNVDKTLHKIAILDILCISSDKNYVTVYTKTRKFTYLDSLKNWIEKLPEYNFTQIHKSHIINHEEINKISGNIVYMRDQKIPIGRSYKSQILKKLKIH